MNNEIERVKKYLSKRGEGLSLGRDHIHGFHKAPLLASDIEALIAKVESLAADAERLDFVIEKGAFITWSLRDSTIKQCQLMNQDEDEDFHHLSGDDKYFNTVRAAIDASMAKEKAQ